MRETPVQKTQMSSLTQQSVNQLWVEFDHVGQERQLPTFNGRYYWVVRSGGEEITIKAIADGGPLLHGTRPDGSEVCFSPACVLRTVRAIE